MSKLFFCEPLESRQLFDGLSFGAANPGIDIANIVGVSASTDPTVATVVPIGPVSDNLYLAAYVKNGALVGQTVAFGSPGILHTLGQETQLSPNGFPVNPSEPLAATIDSNGNAVIVFTSGEAPRDLYMVRVGGNTSGQLIAAGFTQVSIDADDQSLPSVAAGPNGEIAVAWVSETSSGSESGASVDARVFDVGNHALFAATQISGAAAAGVVDQRFDSVAAVYNPFASTYVIAWSLDTADSDSHNLGSSVVDHTLTDSGAVGSANTVLTSATDFFTGPVLVADSTGHQVLLVTGDALLDAQEVPGGSVAKLFSLNASGAATSLNSNLATFPTPQIFVPNSVVDAPDNSHFTLFGEIASITAGSGLAPTGDQSITFDNQGNVMENVNSNLRFDDLTPPTILPLDIQGVTTEEFLGFSYVYDSANNLTQIFGQPGFFIGSDDKTPANPVAQLSASTVTRNGDGAAPSDMVLTATLDISADKEIDIIVTDVPTGSSTSGNSFNTSFSGVIVIPAGQTAGTVNIPIAPYDVGDPTSGSITFFPAVGSSVNSTTDFTISGQTFAGQVTTVFPMPAKPINMTISSGKPVSVGDGDGTTATFSIVSGSAVLTSLPDGNLKLTLSNTNAKTAITISAVTAPNSSADRFFNLEQLIASAAISSINAPLLNINGQLTLKSAKTITLGNIAGQANITTTPATTLKFGDITKDKVKLIGAVKSLALHSATGSTFTAVTIGALSASGNFNADLSATSVTTFTVAGTLGGSGASDIRKLRAAASFGTISANAFENLDLFAGVKPTTTTLPTSRSVFTNPKASIATFKLTGSSAFLFNTIIAAPNINAINLTGIQTTNRTPLGLVAEKITTYKRGSVTRKNLVKKGIFDSQDQFTAKIV